MASVKYLELNNWKKENAKCFIKCCQYMGLTNMKTSLYNQLFKKPQGFLVEWIS